MSRGTIDWPGQSGTLYRYTRYGLNEVLPAQYGNYCFAAERSDGFYPTYFGETQNPSHPLYALS